MDENTKICLLAPTSSLFVKSRELVQKYHKKVEIYQASLVNALPLAEKLLAQQDCIFISRRGTKRIIEEAYQAQVVPIENILEDYVPIMEIAAQKEGLIAFFPKPIGAAAVRRRTFLFARPNIYNIRSCHHG